MPECPAAVSTDSLEQARAYSPPFFLSGTPHMEPMTDLSQHVAGGAPNRSDDNVTLYCSVGLSGTEVVVADLGLWKRG